MLHQSPSAKVDQSLKDGYLIFEAGRTIQSECNKRAGISSKYLNKILSLILRNWDLIRGNVTDYKDIHDWGIFHTAYRYGEIIYQPEKKLINEYDEHPVNFINDIFSTNNILKNYTTYNNYLYQFLEPEPNLFQKLLQDIETQDKDHELICQLVKIFSKLNDTDLYLLATCPDEESTFRAIEAEYIMWWFDIAMIDRILTKLIYDPKNNHDKLLKDLSEKIESSFNCCNQIIEKVGSYSSEINRISNELGNVINDPTHWHKLIDPLKSKIGDGQITHRIKLAIDTTDITTGYIGLLLKLFDISEISLTVLSNIKNIAISKIHYLKVVGFSENELDKLYESTLINKVNPNELYNDIYYHMNKLKSNLKEYMKNNGLPNFSDLHNLFP